MKKNQAFREWMIEVDKMKKNSSDQYSSYLNNVEKVYGNIDDYMLGVILKAIKRDFVVKNFDGKTDDDMNDYKSMVAKYWQYLMYKKSKEG